MHGKLFTFHLLMTDGDRASPGEKEQVPPENRVLGTLFRRSEQLEIPLCRQHHRPTLPAVIDPVGHGNGSPREDQPLESDRPAAADPDISVHHQNSPKIKLLPGAGRDRQGAVKMQISPFSFARGRLAPLLRAA